MCITSQQPWKCSFSFSFHMQTHQGLQRLEVLPKDTHRMINKTRIRTLMFLAPKPFMAPLSTLFPITDLTSYCKYWVLCARHHTRWWGHQNEKALPSGNPQSSEVNYCLMKCLGICFNHESTVQILAAFVELKQCHSHLAPFPTQLCQPHTKPL